MIPEPIEPLVTERLVLRLVEASDADAIHRYRGNPAITRYLSHGPLTGMENSDRLTEVLALRAASTSKWFNYGWAITLRTSGEFIGDARTWNTAALGADGLLSPGRHPAHHAALGYVLHPDHQHRGYGREAAQALVNWLFGVRRISTVVAGAYEPNTPSIRLLRSLGFQQDPVNPVDQDTANKGYPLLMFRLDSPQHSSA